MPSILIADDEPSVRQFLRKVLMDAGHEVLEASNGKEAMSQIRQTSIDLLITALVMPEQDGVETIRVLRKQYPELRIIATSGALRDAQLEGILLRVAVALGVKATIQQPLTADVVLETVQRVLDAPLQPRDRNTSGCAL